MKSILMALVFSATALPAWAYEPPAPIVHQDAQIVEGGMLRQALAERDFAQAQADHLDRDVNMLLNVIHRINPNIDPEALPWPR